MTYLLSDRDEFTVIRKKTETGGNILLRNKLLKIIIIIIIILLLLLLLLLYYYYYIIIIIIIIIIYVSIYSFIHFDLDFLQMIFTGIMGIIANSENRLYVSNLNSRNLHSFLRNFFL